MIGILGTVIGAFCGGFPLLEARAGLPPAEAGTGSTILLFVVVKSAVGVLVNCATLLSTTGCGLLTGLVASNSLGTLDNEEDDDGEAVENDWNGCGDGVVEKILGAWVTDEVLSRVLD